MNADWNICPSSPHHLGCYAYVASPDFAISGEKERIIIGWSIKNILFVLIRAMPYFASLGFTTSCQRKGRRRRNFSLCTARYLATVMELFSFDILVRICLRTGYLYVDQRWWPPPPFPTSTYICHPITEEFIGNYTLSFWWNGRVQHGRIRSTTPSSDKTKYFLVDNMPFDTVQDLINYYKCHRSVVSCKQVPFLYCTSELFHGGCYINRIYAGIKNSKRNEYVAKRVCLRLFKYCHPVSLRFLPFTFIGKSSQRLFPGMGKNVFKFTAFSIQPYVKKGGFVE